ncbi:hypothetical protein TRFO_25481 [Tritrichomonas foetus]|uniref:Uncharacterized protein n=1 Tax=Tritrichomonas foetus TaxID=1144522 RepID=A0A1J4K637_9EUKA|nr:hypothetical protein TRFO_25481 [Tritrichomonas foetus]|eukprot:OHT06458.1 hypothetical protein TRFO_25481 [Tritrichomonas foetus]
MASLVSMASNFLAPYGQQFMQAADFGGIAGNLSNTAGKMVSDWAQSGNMLNDVKSAAQTGGNFLQRFYYGTLRGNNEKVKELDNKNIRIMANWAYDRGTNDVAKYLSGSDTSKSVTINSVKDFMNNILDVREKMAKDGIDSPKVQDLLRNIDFQKGNDAVKNTIHMLSNQMTDDQNPLAPLISQAVSGLTKMLGVTNPAALAAISVAELIATINPLRKGLISIGKAVAKGLFKGAKWVWNKIRGKKNIETRPDVIQVMPQANSVTNEQLLQLLAAQHQKTIDQFYPPLNVPPAQVVG